MAHAQKPDFVFRRKGRVHLNRHNSGKQNFVFVRKNRTGDPPPPFQKSPDVLWVPTGVISNVYRLFTGSKQLGCDDDHTLPSSAKVTVECSCASTPPTRLHDADGDFSCGLAKFQVLERSRQSQLSVFYY